MWLIDVNARVMFAIPNTVNTWPNKYVREYTIAVTIARHSFSMAAYLVSAGFSFLEKKAMSDASVCRSQGVLKSGLESTGWLANAASIAAMFARIPQSTLLKFLLLPL